MTEITIATTLPANDDELQARLRDFRERKKEKIADIDASRESITKDNYRTMKQNEFDGAEKRLKECADAVAREATPDWAKVLLVEIAAARNEITAAVKARKATIQSFKAQYDPPDPTDFRAIIVECTAKTWKLLDAYLAKSSGINIGTAKTIDAADVKRVAAAVDEAAKRREERLDKARASIA